MTAAFADEHGNALTPTSISYTVSDVDSGTVIVNSTSVTPASSVTITIAPSTNDFIDSSNNTETRRLIITAPYSSTENINASFEWQILNLGIS